MRRPTTDLTGARVGRLIVLEKAGLDKGRNVLWKCQCDCGKTKIILGTRLKYGKTKSCGCLMPEAVSACNKKRLVIHGMSDTLTGWSWMTMMQRCFNPKARGFDHYGGRGILPCEFIKASPLNLVLLIGERPSQSLTLHRLNNDLGYCCGACGECLKNGWPKNVGWADKKTQARNRTNTRYVTINGVTKGVAEWVEETGIPRTTFLRMYLGDY
jgi:hypothetical protein